MVWCQSATLVVECWRNYDSCWTDWCGWTATLIDMFSCHHHRESEWLTMALGLCVINSDLMDYYKTSEHLKTVEITKLARDVDAALSESYTERFHYFRTHEGLSYVLRRKSDLKVLQERLRTLLRSPTKENTYALIEIVYKFHSAFNSMSMHEYRC